MDDARGEITRLVQQWSEGDESALDGLIELAYDDLRVIAHRHLRRSRGDQTLQTTALVHEVYMRLAGVDEGAWATRAHFFAFCSKAMRRILIDYARRQQAAKRGGDRVRVPLTDQVASLDAEIAEVLAVDQALETLARHDERLAQIVECRFFGGLTVPETAEALDLSTRTVERDWVRARAYLYRMLRTDEEEGEAGAEGGAPGADVSGSP